MTKIKSVNCGSRLLRRPENDQGSQGVAGKQEQVREGKSAMRGVAWSAVQHVYMNERPRKLRWIGGHLFFCKVSASAYAD